MFTCVGANVRARISNAACVASLSPLGNNISFSFE